MIKESCQDCERMGNCPILIQMTEYWGKKLVCVGSINSKDLQCLPKTGN